MHAKDDDDILFVSLCTVLGFFLQNIVAGLWNWTRFIFYFSCILVDGRGVLGLVVVLACRVVVESQ